MTNTQFQKFYGKLLTLLSKTSYDRIKYVAGSSTENNRIPSVNQVIRFLELSGTYGHKTMAKDLRYVYNQVKPDIRFSRSFTRRTDAYDIYEFLNVFDR